MLTQFRKPLKCAPIERIKVYLKPSIVKSDAVLAQLVEHDLAKVGVTSSSLVYRSKFEVQSVQFIEHDLDHNSRGHECFLASCRSIN